MRNFRLVLAYDGTDFAGWQVQPDAPTIQGTLQTAIRRLTGEKVLPQGSGRTDAGVHALAQVATFSTASPIPAGNLVKALNAILPASIRVLEAMEAPENFHARKSARAKTYHYRVYRQPICPPFLARYVWHFPYPLDERAMSCAAQYVVGEHNFASFAALDPEIRFQRLQKKANGEPPSVAGETFLGDGAVEEGVSKEASDVRTIFSSEWRRTEDEFIYTVRGSGFLHHMVRNLVGTFILVGKGALTPEDIPRIVEARSRSAAGATVPASGLFLVSVDY